METLLYKGQNYYSCLFHPKQRLNNPFVSFQFHCHHPVYPYSIFCQDYCNSFLTDLSKFSLAHLTSEQITLSGFIQYACLTTSFCLILDISVVPYSEPITFMKGHKFKVLHTLFPCLKLSPSFTLNTSAVLSPGHSSDLSSSARKPSLASLK